MNAWESYLPYLRVIAEQATRRSAVPGLDPSSIAQTAIVEAWKSRGSFRGDNDEVFLAWMRGILSNVMRSAVRQQIRRPQSIDWNTLDAALATYGNRITVFANSIPDPVEALQANERALQLAAALEKLTSDHRTILIARHFEDRSFADIARQFDRSEAATRMLWVRALRALRQAYCQNRSLNST